MGEKITPRPKSADLARAKQLKQALQQGSPPALLGTNGIARKIEGAAAPSWSDDNPEVHRAFLEQLVECTTDAISILNTRYCVTRINSEFTRMFGFSSEEALGQRIDALIVPPDRNAETRWIAETVERGQKV